MSDTDTETTPDPETPVEDAPAEDASAETEPEIELPGDDEDGEQDERVSEDDVQPGEEAEYVPPGVAEAQLRSERELEALHRKIERENTRHTTAIGKIMGDDANGLIDCPVCMDFTQGHIFPPDVAPLPETVKERMRQLLGMDNWESIPQPAWAQTCEDCAGHGEVRTGSLAAGKETTRCQTCQGDGWINLKLGTLVAMHPPETITETGPTVYGHEISNDPDVQSLRERGFTVIPPMTVAN